MRIKKKGPKPSSKRPPLYFVGYRGSVPGIEELKTWYDLEYHGPLSVKPEEDAPESWRLSHGPWTAHVVIPLPATHQAGLKDQLAWEHESMGVVAPSITSPREMPDSVLFAARVARGLTLLTQGTAHDPATRQYLNPSDWKDRTLVEFVIDDHVTIAQDDEARPDHTWWYTLGLAKFGMDELETFRPKGLSDQRSNELLAESAHEMIRIGVSPKVGTAFHLPMIGRTIRVTNHRTAAPTGRMQSFREITV
ncbi:conserved protein of unknown function [Nitrospira japonica]|uniref:DUF4261 domain-containing protein n=1 Tax=Nitrospira japonica TaxID=1325564 RepID=A0A1W1I193_9BACT|nr:hypothetical protein [Nitrospira japonica]SLM46751.1 conserved protein of unknown function [Nitrospira japonica]